MAVKINAAEVAQQARDISLAAPSLRFAMSTAVRRRITGLDAQLDTQFTWLGENQHYPRWPEYFDRWEADLHHYERACDALRAAPKPTQEQLFA